MDRNELRLRALSGNRSPEEIAPPKPTPETDAAPPEGDDTKIIFLAGAIKAWWLHRCPTCIAYWNRPTVCWHTVLKESHKPTPTEPMWDSPMHQEYLTYRRDLQTALIATNRYLTYAPHNAFKGRWTNKAQAVNDAGIAMADLMVVMSPAGIPTQGTDDEVDYAREVGTEVAYLPSSEWSVERAIEAIDLWHALDGDPFLDVGSRA